jgi:regulator of cell morphogenesis and NO signaling
MNITRFTAIGSIVADNPQAAGVFNHYGIDFYSQGKRSLENACLEENLPVISLVEELCALKDPVECLPDFRSMNLRTLSTYILRTHHRFTEKKLVFIKNTLGRLMWSADEPDGSVVHLNKRFQELSVYLTVHMKHEEFIIFPSIHALEKRGRGHLALQTIQNLIKSMVEDHRYEVMTLKSLSELTNNYMAPPNADYALTITYSALRDLEEDLKIHMHLENNILFPKAGVLMDVGSGPRK